MVKCLIVFYIHRDSIDLWYCACCRTYIVQSYMHCTSQIYYGKRQFIKQLSFVTTLGSKIFAWQYIVHIIYYDAFGDIFKYVLSICISIVICILASANMCDTVAIKWWSYYNLLKFNTILYFILYYIFILDLCLSNHISDTKRPLRSYKLCSCYEPPQNKLASLTVPPCIRKYKK